MAISKIDSDGIVSGGITADSLNIGQIGGRRNLIINGSQIVAQRGTSSTSGGFQTVDRFEFNASNGDQIAFTQSQSSESPDDFSNSYKIDVTTAETAIDADDHFWLGTKLEAQDLQQLNYGTASAQSFTLSFYVRSALTGTYAVWFYSSDGNRSITSTYTINTADTWERKTLTIVGDSSGTINNDNGVGFEIRWMLAAGSNYTSADSTSWGADAANRRAYNHTAQWGTSASHDFHITGVQLEVGSVATPFEHRSYGEELALCQRYFHKHDTKNGGSYIFIGSGGTARSSTNITGIIQYPLRMRSAPTLTSTSITATRLLIADNSTAVTGIVADQIGVLQAAISVTVSSGLTAGSYYMWLAWGSEAPSVNFDAEL